MQTIISESELQFIGAFRDATDYIILCLAAICLVANCAVIIKYFFIANAVKKQIPNLMLFNQAIVDLIIASYATLSTLPNFFKLLMQEKYYNVMRVVLKDYSIFLALGVLVIASGERTLALHRPSLNFKVVSLWKIISLVVGLWLVSLIPCIVLLFYTKPEGHINTKEFYVIYSSFRVGLVLVGVSTILVMLFLSFRTVRKSLRDLKRVCSFSKRSRTDADIQEEETSKKEMRLIVLLATMAVVFAVSYLPMGVFSIVRNIAMQTLGFFGMIVMEICVFILYISSAIINPFLTLFVKEDFYTFTCQNGRCEVRCCCCRARKKQEMNIKVEILSVTDLPEDNTYEQNEEQIPGSSSA